MKETVVNFSPNESNILNLKVGRCVTSNLNTEQLIHQITNQQFDIVRLCISSAEEDAVQKLEKTGLPYYYSGSITRYKTNIDSLPERDFIHPDIIYEQYDGSQNNLLLELLKDTWGSYPIGYYRTPYLNQIIDKEQEIMCVYEFYKKNNLQKDYPNNSIIFMKHNGDYVGFFALNIIEDRLESHIGGITEAHRTGGYFYDMQEYIRRFCLLKKLKYFCFGARNENRRVQHIFQKFGYTAVDADNIFHIPSLLSLHAKKDHLIEENITLSDPSYFTLLKVLHSKTDQYLQHFNLSTTSRYTLKSCVFSPINENDYKLVCTIPVSSPCTNMLVLKVLTADSTLAACAYLYSDK